MAWALRRHRHRVLRGQREALLPVEHDLDVAVPRVAQADLDGDAVAHDQRPVDSMCGQIGVRTTAASVGWRIGPPAARL
jgi:hypothetical protein